jgi:hypothetical protein
MADAIVDISLQKTAKAAGRPGTRDVVRGRITAGKALARSRIERGVIEL